MGLDVDSQKAPRRHETATRSSDEAYDCIADTDAGVKAYYGRNSYCDRVVMVRHDGSEYHVEPYAAAYDEVAA